MKINLLFFCVVMVMHVPGATQDLLVRQNGDGIDNYSDREDITSIALNNPDRNGKIRCVPNNDTKESMLKQRYTATLHSWEIPKDSNDVFPRFRIALGGGYSYRIASISEDASPEMAEYLEGFKSGFHFQGEIAHYFTSKFGVGAYYSIMSAKASGDVLVTTGSFTNMKEINSTANIHLVGPLFSVRLFNDSQRNASLITISPCYLIYSEETRVALSPFRVTGNTLGMAISYAYEMGISDNMAIGAKLSAIFASGDLYNKEIHFPTAPAELESGQLEDFNRVDLSLYLRFGKI